jgi:4-hydroxymandelate oxidase
MLHRSSNREPASEWLSLRHLEIEARRRLDPAVYDYFAGGADDEVTLRANEFAFARIGLLPRVLVGTGEPELATTLLGCPISMPIVIAPTAFHRLAHADGERATARAAATAGTILIVSMAATVAVDEIASEARSVAPESDVHLWFQLYLQPDLQFTEGIIRRAEAAGCKALVITVDSPVFGNRERDLRNGLTDLPAGVCCENLRDGRVVREIAFSREFSWQHIRWLRQITSLPIVLKGVQHPSDSQLAIDNGADALIVSNHGGRQLDTVPATIDVLPAIADAVEGRIPVLMDGGIRRGTDVIKALALGASAVAVGRPVLWGLAADGEHGVKQMLEMLRAETVRALTLCGCRSPRELSRDLLQRSNLEGRCSPSFQ